MSPADEFLALLRDRLPLALLRHADIVSMGPVYRCDRLFEAGADLSDALVAYEADHVGPDVLREHALDVALLAVTAYLATVTAHHQPEKDDQDGSC